MPKVTYNPGPGDPQETTFAGKPITAGKSIDVTDERQLEKARGNRFFSVSGDKGAKAAAQVQADAEAAAAADMPSQNASNAPMWPEAHDKAEVMPSGTISAEVYEEAAQAAVEEDEAQEAKSRRGRPKRG
jgi:hypothetical protein